MGLVSLGDWTGGGVGDFRPVSKSEARARKRQGNPGGKGCAVTALVLLGGVVALLGGAVALTVEVFT